MNHEESFICVSAITTLSSFSLSTEIGKWNVQTRSHLSASYEPAVTSEHKSPLYKLWQYATKDKPSTHNDDTVPSNNKEIFYRDQLSPSYQSFSKRFEQSEDDTKESITSKKRLFPESKLSFRKQNDCNIRWCNVFAFVSQIYIIDRVLLCLKTILRKRSIYNYKGYSRPNNFTSQISPNPVWQQLKKSHGIYIYINKIFAGVLFMTIPNFIMLAAVYASAVHPTTFKNVVMQKSKNDFCAINVRDNYKLSHQMPIFKETTECFRQNRHNFDVYLKQIHVQNLKWFDISFSDVFDPCKNFKVVQSALNHCSEQTISRYNFERTKLQTVLNFYNLKSFKGGSPSAYRQKVAFHSEDQASAITSGESQEPVKLHRKKQEQQINLDPLLSPSEELADAFTHKASGVRDAFTKEDIPSLEKQQE